MASPPRKSFVGAAASCAGGGNAEVQGVYDRIMALLAA
jgi:hypothetical protein